MNYFDNIKTVGLGYAINVLHSSGGKIIQMIEEGKLPAYINEATGRIRINIDDINLYKERLKERSLIPYHEYKNRKKGIKQQELNYENS